MVTCVIQLCRVRDYKEARKISENNPEETLGR